jgi:ABC-2 type transport system permease protein
MRARFASLLRFSILSLYGLRGSGVLKRGEAVSAASDVVGASGEGHNADGKAGDGSSSKAQAKAVAKAVGIALLALLVTADIGGIFFMTNWAMYRALKPEGLQGLLILNSAMSASLLVFILGFATALSTYCLSSAETLMLTLPARPSHVLGAKIATIYLSDCLLAFILMAAALGVYAVGEHPGALFYVYGLLAVLALPLLPIAFSYLVLVPLMSLIRFLRNRNAMLIAGGVVGIALALAFNLLIQSVSIHLNDPAWILANYAGPDTALTHAGKAYLPALLVWKSVSAVTEGGQAASTIGSGLRGAAFAIANLALGVAAVVLVSMALGRAYTASLSRFGETRLKRLGSSRDFIARKMRKRRPGVALFLREFRLMNREPVYFLNGPFVVLLMPIIIAVLVLTEGKVLGPSLAQLGDIGSGPWLMLVAAGSGAFLGSATSITCTAISRDAKALAYLKTLPLSLRSFAMAKFFHGFAFAVFGALVGAVGLGLAMGLSLVSILEALFIALALASLMNIAGLWLDTANPRLSWDSPTAALKQNPNAAISILVTMGLFAGLGVLAPAIKLPALGFVGLYGILPAALAAIAIALYPRYAQKRIARIDC